MCSSICLVFKSHGSADAFAFERALTRAYDAARNDLLERVRERVAHAAPLLGALQVDPTLTPDVGSTAPAAADVAGDTQTRLEVAGSAA